MPQRNCRVYFPTQEVDIKVIQSTTYTYSDFMSVDSLSFGLADWTLPATVSSSFILKISPLQSILLKKKSPFLIYLKYWLNHLKPRLDGCLDIPSCTECKVCLLLYWILDLN